MIATDENRFLLVNVGSGKRKLALSQIVRIEGYGNYCKVFTLHKAYVVTKTIRIYEEQFGAPFYRAHKRHLVNLDQMREVVIEKREITLRMLDESQIPVARLRVKSFMDLKFKQLTMHFKK